MSFGKLRAERRELELEIKNNWATLSAQRARAIETRMGELDARLLAIKNLPSVAGMIQGS